MKQHFCSKLSITIGLSLISFSSLSAQIVYGLNQARQFRSYASKDIYIQTGSYKNKSYALRAKSQLKNKSHYPVFLKEERGYYKVMLGPFRTATEVRIAAQPFDVKPSVIRASQNPVVASAKIAHAASPITIVKISPVYKDKDAVTPKNHWFIGVGGGWVDPFGTGATNFASSGMPEFPDDRYASTGSKSAGQVSGFVGYQWRRSNLYFPAVSLSFEYSYTFPLGVHGDIYVNDLPDAKNFTYKYDISQQLPMTKLKLDLYRWKQLMPYISGGVGAVVNHGYNYSDSPIPGATVMHRRFGFTSTNKTRFAGSFGAGLDYWFKYNTQISVGYELAYYGKASTGKGQGALNANRLESNLNSNGVVVKGTYFFN